MFRIDLNNFVETVSRLPLQCCFAAQLVDTLLQLDFLSHFERYLRHLVLLVVILFVSFLVLLDVLVSFAEVVFVDLVQCIDNRVSEFGASEVNLASFNIHGINQLTAQNQLCWCKSSCSAGVTSNNSQGFMQQSLIPVHWQSASSKNAFTFEKRYSFPP